METIKIQCTHCGYQWETQSKREYITCPSCFYKISVKKGEVSVEQTGKLESRALENWLWEAACSIRGSVDAPKFKDFILPLVFAKRLSDVYDDELVRLIEQFGDMETALDLIKKDHGLVRFYIPQEARWENVRKSTTRVGESITDALRAIAKENPKLQGVIDAVDFNATYAGQRVIDDVRLQALIEALSDPRYRLGLKDVEPDILGRAYEYLLRKFAEGQGQSAGEFFTPKEVGWINARIMNPKQGQSAYDPTCGSGGLLVKCELMVQEKYKEIKQPLQLYGQEMNHVTYAMAKMNMIVHDMEGDIAIGDTLRNPKFLKGPKLMQFDMVVANPMWMQQGYSGDFYEIDPFGRFEIGYPNANSADWGWIQHMLASLKENGKAAIVIDTGAVTRGSGSDGSNKEKEIRKRFVEKDLIEAVVLLPENLFYNTTAAGIILVLNKAKPSDRKDQIALINASTEFVKGRPKNFIPEDKILKIANAFHEWKDILGFVKVVTKDEVKSKDYNLLPSRYVGPELTAEIRPLSEILKDLSNSEKRNVELDVELQNVIAVVKATNKQNNWGKKPIGTAVELIMGQSPPSQFYNSTGDGLPFLQGKADFTTKYPQPTKYCTKRVKVAPEGSVLMSVRAPVGDVNLADRAYIIGRGVAALRLKEGDNNFLFYLLTYLKPQIEALGTGTTFDSVNKGTLEQLEIPIPPIKDQERISKILSLIDEKIAIEEGISARLRELYQTVLHQLIIGTVEKS